MLDLVVNPISGGKNGKRMQKNLALIEKRLKEKNVEYKIHKTLYAKHAITLTQELIKCGSTTIVAVGGDGTLHEVLNGFSDFANVSLGIIPCGTGNDFAGAIGLPSNVVKAVDIILNGKAVFTDYMQMPTVRGINIIGLGVDVQVLQKYEELKNKTRFGYTKCLMKTLRRFEYAHFDAEFNGEKKYYHSFIACVANGKMYGGGIKICPDAVADDGWLNFVTVKAIKKSSIVSAFLKLKQGKILSQPYVCQEFTKNICIREMDDYYVNVDGELYKNIPFDVQIVSRKLRIFR